MSEHTCHARKCNVEVPPAMFMCRKHWYMLPATMRKEVWRVYRPGQEVDKQPTGEYLEVAGRAIDWLENREDEIYIARQIGGKK